MTPRIKIGPAGDTRRRDRRLAVSVVLAAVMVGVLVAQLPDAAALAGSATKTGGPGNPVPLAGEGTPVKKRLRLRVRAQERQRVRELNVLVSCPEAACRFRVEGVASPGGFRLRTVERSLEEGQQARVRLRFRNRSQLHRYEERLHERERVRSRARARITVRAHGGNGEEVKRELQVRLHL